MECPKCKSLVEGKLWKDAQTKKPQKWEICCTRCGWKGSGGGDPAKNGITMEGVLRTETGGDLEYYSRVTGYYQRVSSWNPGKAQEWRDRKRYRITEKEEK